MTTLTLRVFGNAAVGVATGVLTLLILVFGEITPKTMSTLYAEKISFAYAGAIHVPVSYTHLLMDDGGDMYSIMGWAYQRGVDVYKRQMPERASTVRYFRLQFPEKQQERSSRRSGRQSVRFCMPETESALPEPLTLSWKWQTDWAFRRWLAGTPMTCLLYTSHPHL